MDADTFVAPLTANSQLGPTASAVVVYVFGGLVLVVLIVTARVLAARQRARAAMARHALRTSAPLSAGYGVVRGTVETDDDASCAVRVHITQTGDEWEHKGGWSHRWTEVAREVRATPFYLALATREGERVRVEPNDDVFLVDALDQTEQRGVAERTRTSTLEAGEIATVVGVLVRGFNPRAGAVRGGYRAEALGWVLRPPRKDRMLISVEPLEERHVRRASFHAWWSLGLVAAFVFVNAVVFARFHAAMLLGRVVDAELVNVRTWVTTGKGGGTRQYELSAVYEDETGEKQVVQDRVNAGTYARAQKVYYANRRATLPFLVVPRLPTWHQIGDRPTIEAGWVVIVAVGVGLGIAYAFAAASTRPWYERKKVVDTGRGRLGVG